MAAQQKNVGILAMEIYFPPTCIKQVKWGTFIFLSLIFVLCFLGRKICWRSLRGGPVSRNPDEFMHFFQTFYVIVRLKIWVLLLLIFSKVYRSIGACVSFFLLPNLADFVNRKNDVRSFSGLINNLFPQAFCFFSRNIAQWVAYANLISIVFLLKFCFFFAFYVWVGGWENYIFFFSLNFRNLIEILFMPQAHEIYKNLFKQLFCTILEVCLLL